MKTIKNDTVFFTDVYNNEKVIQHYLDSHVNVGMLNVERELIKFAQKHMNRNDLFVSDLGCGTGRFTFNCAKEFPNFKLHGYDISSKMIEAGQKFEQSVPNVEFFVSDLTQETYANYKFDLVFFTFNSLMTMPGKVNKIKSLQNAFRALEDHGLLIFSAPQIDDSDAKREWFNRQRQELANANPNEVLIEKIGDCFWQENNQYGILCHYNIDELIELITAAELPKPLMIKTRDEFGTETPAAQEFSDNALYVVIQK
ncbi:hypothetical protein C4M96_00665 [Mycoplasmopsis pullorum]|uniref:class I SAM-dependent DNA methyltransferase n=1 Tax=Mycoplasmopsis pullorum TaxID=48003 RepID=UPI001118FCA8|nr:class I SAM-dependent methyltransferase [Mycoplasmopsis pullorum]TNK83694.1 hypothetical protein C4M93_01565 [Mycoplasmopsis pullorum]TNK92468.1 hypothetical protein C4M96_00665 [Mycoplasmopsis pullorum]